MDHARDRHRRFDGVGGGEREPRVLEILMKQVMTSGKCEVHGAQSGERYPSEPSCDAGLPCCFSSRLVVPLQDGCGVCVREEWKRLRAQAKLTASDARSEDYLGSAVALSGDIAVVGAFGREMLRGRAYVSKRSQQTWAEQAQLEPADDRGTSWFGTAAAISDATAVIGAPVSATAYVYTRSGHTWTFRAKLTPLHADAQLQSVGTSVGIRGGTIIASGPDIAAGHVFDKAP